MTIEATVNALSVELQIDRRTLQSRFHGVEPHRVEGKSKLYSLQQILIALAPDFMPLDSGDIGEAELRLKAAKAGLAELELAEKRGELVSTSDVCREWSQVGVNIKNKMLALPTRAAPMLIGAASLPEISSVLTTLVREALEELSATPPGAPAQVEVDEAE